MKIKVIATVSALALLFAGVLLRRSAAQSQLSVEYGPNGVQRLTSRSVVLEDLNLFPSDTFHIWHMKMTDLQGKAVSDGQYGWGETNIGKSWSQSTKTWTYNYIWGSIEVQFVQRGDNLDMIVTEKNLANSGVILDGATIYPFGLHLPQLPVNFYDATYPQLAFNTTGPGVTVADYGVGEVIAVVPDASKPLYSGFWPTGSSLGYFPIISSTSPDGLATFQPHNDRPVQPGQTDRFTVSLRFAASKTAPVALAGDAYASWAKTWPARLNWADRRAIGTVYLASSPSGDPSRPGGYSNNPRRYFNDSNPGNFDVRTSDGLARFQTRILQQAADNVGNMRQLNAQGAITWDIEGEQFPQSTSYVCEPDQIAQIAPEMESIVSDRNSPYFGRRLDDAYFKTMTNAGFRVGVCVRPQHFTPSANRTAQQVYLDNSAVAAELIRKMKFAHDRWGATLFYVDSSVESNGAVLDASIFQQVAKAFPDSLIIPEESTPKHYAYTAPFQSFIFHGEVGTDSSVYAYYPKAFSVNLINDADPATLRAKTPQLTAAVKAGDILMAHVDWWQPNNPTIAAIYQAAGASPVSSPPTAPAPPSAPITAPGANVSNVVILTPGVGETVSRSIVVNAQININLDSAGSYLMVDGAEIGTARMSNPPFTYPLETTTLSNGQHTLQVWAHDTGDHTVLSTPVVVTVANAGTGSASSSSQH